LNIQTATSFGEWVQKIIIDPAPIFSIGSPLAWSMWNQYGVFMKPGGILNHLGGGWNDPMITSLWVKGSRAPEAVQAAYWKRITARAVTQAYFVPLIADHALWYVGRKVKGVVVSPKRDHKTFATEWSPA
jgi:hypothetical protein